METRKLDIHIILPPDFKECERCVERLRAALLSLDGMRGVTVDTEDSTLVLTHDRGALTMERIEHEARQIGVSIVERFVHESFEIEGLDCPECALKIEKGVSLLPGVVFASVNYATSTLFVEYESEKLTGPRIARRVRDLGYEVAEKPEPGREIAVRPAWFETRAIFTAVSGLFLLAGIFAAAFGLGARTAQFLWMVSLVFGGARAARLGILGLRALSVDTNLLVTVAAVGAAILGDYRDAATVVFLFSLGSALESYTVEKMRRSVRGLVQLFPTQAAVRRNGSEVKIPIEEIAVGDTLIVRPGDSIATDGAVARGSSWVNEAPITGESTPVEKSEGSKVYAGTVNDRGYLEVTANRTVADNTLTRIIHLVEEAQAHKSPSQRFSERFGRIYSPIVILLAAAALLFGLLPSQTFAEWIRKSLTLLVVACPCALVISTPVAIVAAIGNAARRGLLIKGGAYLENLGSLNVIAFDKTGTLTEGRLEVAEIIPFGDHSAIEALRIAASVERRSEHPLARAILKRSEADGIEPEDVDSFEAIPGKGARAQGDGTVYYVGGERLLDELGISVEPQESVRGKTAVYVVAADEVIGLITFEDSPKPGTAEVLRELKRLGIRKTIMLTGDSEAAAKAIAARIGIDEVHARLLPEEKVAAVQRMLWEHGKAAMVGDGINDAPALAAATVGIAMGGAGTQAVLETADIVLMADDLSKLPFGLALSRKAAWIIKCNLVFSVAVVVGLVVGALSGKLGLSGGILGHEGSALIVILNGMRLLRFSPRSVSNGGP